MNYFFGYGYHDTELLFYMIDAETSEVVIDKYENIKGTTLYYWDKVLKQFKETLANNIRTVVKRGECFYPVFDENNKTTPERCLLLDYNPNSGARVVSTSFKTVFTDTVAFRTYLLGQDGVRLNLINDLYAGDFWSSNLNFYNDKYTEDMLDQEISGIQKKIMAAEMFNLEEDVLFDTLLTSFETNAFKNAAKLNGKLEYPMLALYKHENEIRVFSAKDNYVDELMNTLNNNSLFYVTTTLQSHVIKSICRACGPYLRGIYITAVKELLPKGLETATPTYNNLKYVFFSEGCGLLKIHSNAFFGSKVKSIVLPNSVVELDKAWKNGCDTLKTLYVAENKVRKGTKLTKIGGVLADICKEDPEFHVINRYTGEEMTLI